MTTSILDLVKTMNPWLESGDIYSFSMDRETPRSQTKKMLLPDWDRMGMILSGPRHAGKTTLGNKIAHTLIQNKRFDQLLYLDCDYPEIRYFLNIPSFIAYLMEGFDLERAILFIDDVHKLKNPERVLSEILASNLPLKLMASTASQICPQDGLKEFLILPLSHQELGVSRTEPVDPETFTYGLLPMIFNIDEPEYFLELLYNLYIKEDIAGCSSINKPDVMWKLIPRLAQTTGQLVNYTDLAQNADVSNPTIQLYCSVLEKTYIISRLTPFVGKKRKELISNPIYYFIDSGFQNAARGDFSPVSAAAATYQELLKYKALSPDAFDIHYWRTQSGAKVDFILTFNEAPPIPIDSTYDSNRHPTISRSYKSFIKAYAPKVGIIITDNFSNLQEVEGCMIHFIPLQHLTLMLDVIQSYIGK